MGFPRLLADKPNAMQLDEIRPLMPEELGQPQNDSDFAADSTRYRTDAERNSLFARRLLSVPAAEGNED